jgi:hypothetical protein
MSNEILLRKDAIRQGLTKYFTGKVCPHGHIAERYVLTSACTKCVLTYQKRSKQNLYDTLRMKAEGFEKREFLVHPMDTPIIKKFIKFVNDSRIDKRRNKDIQLVQEYIWALELAWSFT